MLQVAKTISNRTLLRVTAELTVIVVGVLAAFAVDDWADRRADRLVEVQYLEALASDLRADSLTFAERQLPGLARRQAALESIIPVARGEAPIPLDTIGFLIEVTASHRTPFLDLHAETFQELLATGSLRLLESPEVRSAVIRYYQSRDLAVTRSESRESPYADLVRSYLPERASNTGVGRGEAEAMLRKFGGLPDAVAALRTPEFVRAMNQHFNYVALMRPTLEDLLTELQELIPLIDGELARLSQ